MDALPPPEHPVLRALADRLEATRQVAEVWDARWRLVHLTTDYLLSVRVTALEAAPSIGEPVYSQRTRELRQAWPGAATDDSWLELTRRRLPAIAHDLPGGVDELGRELTPELAGDLATLTPHPGDSMTVDHCDIKFGRRTTPFVVMGTRISDDDGAVAGTCWIAVPALSGAAVSMLATGDHRSLERLLGIVTPERRPGAVLFADLEGSTALAKTLPASEYFRLVRRLMTWVDDEIIGHGGLVGKHAGDGVTALFLTEQHTSESAAARACVEAMRAIRARTAEIAQRSDLGPDEVVLRFGLHWGANLYVGRLLTSGRAEVTALGDAMNEAARIEASASGGRALASKDLIERLDSADAGALGLDSGLRFTQLAGLSSATDKARRDAPSIAICDV